MKNTIQVNSKGKTEYLFIDQITQVLIKPTYHVSDYEYTPPTTKKYWIPWFNSSTIEGVWFYPDKIYNRFVSKEKLQEWGYYFKGEELWHSSWIKVYLNDDNVHLFQFNDKQVGDFNKLVDELESLVNVKIKIEK